MGTRSWLGVWLLLAACGGPTQRRGPPLHLLDDDPPAAAAPAASVEPEPSGDDGPSLAKQVLDAEAARDTSALLPQSATQLEPAACSPSPRQEGPLFGVWSRADEVLAVGELYGKAGDDAVRTQILSSADGGKTWNKLATHAACGLRAVWGQGDRERIAVGERGTLLSSDDGGRSWTLRPRLTSDDLVAVWGIGDDRYALASGLEAAAFGSALLRSRDAGKSWQLYRFPYAARIAGLWGPSPSELLAVGDSGVILRSTDGGAHWQRRDSGINAALTGVWGRGALRYAVGHGGHVLESADGGEHWKKVRSGDETLHAVSGHGAAVIAVGEDGTVLSSQRGPWRTMRQGTTDVLLALWSTPTAVFAVGRDHRGVAMIGNMGSISHAGVHTHDTHGGVAIRSTDGARWALSWGSFSRKKP